MVRALWRKFYSGSFHSYCSWCRMLCYYKTMALKFQILKQRDAHKGRAIINLIFY
jgi:hypothetical protein